MRLSGLVHVKKTRSFLKERTKELLFVTVCALGMMAGHADAASDRVEALDAARALIGDDFHSFSLITVYRDNSDDVLWASWSPHYPPHSEVDLALLRKQGHGIKVLWSHRFPNGYEPRINQLYGDVPRGLDGLYLHYQLGADEAVAVFLALDKHDAVSIIGSLDGQSADLLTTSGNVVQVTTSPSDPRTCYAWKPGTYKFSELPCPLNTWPSNE